MEHTEDRVPPAMGKLKEELEAGPRDLLVETGQRFIGDQDRWIPEQAPNQSQSMTLAAGECADFPVFRNAVQPDPIHDRGQPVLVRRKATGTVLVEGEADVLAHRPRQHGGILRHQRDS